MLRNTRARWGALSQLFHWLIAALIGVQIALGLIGTELPLSMTKLATLARHKSLGITLLALMLVRLAWRALNPTPALPDTLKPHERVLARITHTGLYVLVIALPLTGWIMSSARASRSAGSICSSCRTWWDATRRSITQWCARTCCSRSRSA